MKTEKKLDRCIIIGIIIELLISIPYIILGGDGAVSIHDQLDIEVLSYILNAKHFLDASIPEFMVASKQSMVPASYGTLLFYYLFNGEKAFIINYLFVQFIAFLGLYLLLKELKINRVLALIISVYYSMLPFYSVFGLSVMGQPFLFWAVIKSYQGKKYPIFITALFAIFSSPVLIGYADIGILIVLAVILIIKKQWKQAKQICFVVTLMVLIYIVLYFPLLIQVFNKSGFISHRDEYVLSFTKSLDEWLMSYKSLWNDGLYHAVSNHKKFIPWVLGSLYGMILVLPFINNDGKHKLNIIMISSLSLVIITAFYASWKSSFIGNIREALGGIFVTFQADRLYWLYPTLWYVAFGQALDILLNSFSVIQKSNNMSVKYSALSKKTSVIIAVILLLSVGVQQYSNSYFKKNCQYVLNGTPALATTYNNFYSTDLFNEIRDYIGKPQEQYRVGSVALYPTVPLYNGFYCIDGYSTNYDVNYKHKFRKIIANELEKNDEIKNYFDGWGNRCYLFTSEIGKNYYFLKNSTRKINDLELDANAMRELNCQYIFSGLEILNPSLSGLVFLQKFENERSPYRIWLYQVEGDAF